jgi:hypothetical protein
MQSYSAITALNIITLDRCPLRGLLTEAVGFFSRSGTLYAARKKTKHYYNVCSSIGVFILF